MTPIPRAALSLAALIAAGCVADGGAGRLVMTAQADTGLLPAADAREDPGIVPFAAGGLWSVNADLVIAPPPAPIERVVAVDPPRPLVQPAAVRPWCPDPAAGGLRFDNGVDPETEIVVAAVGDLLLHSPLQRQAFADPDGWRSLWVEVEDLIAGADIAYANLEGAVAEGVTKQGSTVATPVNHFDDWVYSSYPLFNYHPSLAPALRASGFDVVSTANNHSLDRFAVGADRTIEAVSAAGLAFTGTRPSDLPQHAWHVLTDVGRYRLAWLACTYGTNGVPDRAGQVLQCFDSRTTVLQTITELANRDDIDAVIVTPHWGWEYNRLPNDDQRQLAAEMLDAGAVAVLGSHPHVVQPWERYVTADGRDTLVAYSLGNFVSNQRELPRRSSLILLLGLAEAEDGRLAVAGARYVPIHVNFFGGPAGNRRTVEAIDRVGRAADSRALLAELLGEANIHPANGPLTTIANCPPVDDAPATITEAQD